MGGAHQATVLWGLLIFKPQSWRPQVAVCALCWPPDGRPIGFLLGWLEVGWRTATNSVGLWRRHSAGGTSFLPSSGPSCRPHSTLAGEASSRVHSAKSPARSSKAPLRAEQPLTTKARARARCRCRCLASERLSSRHRSPLSARDYSQRWLGRQELVGQSCSGRASRRRTRRLERRLDGFCVRAYSAAAAAVVVLAS